MIDKVNDEFIVDCTNNSTQERQQVYKFLVDNRNYDKGYLGNDFSIIVCNKKQGNTNWRILSDAKEINGKNYNVYTFEQFKEMYLEEEFVLPEKWCIRQNKQEINGWANKNKQTDSYYSDLSGVHLFHFPKISDIHLYVNVQLDYKEITFEQFLKYVLKQETMEKEIIGYKLVKPEYKGAYEKITNTANLDRIEDSLGKLNWVDKAIKDLKEAGVLELWFKPNYKEEKTIVKMHSSNKGEFEIEVVDKKAYYKPDGAELTKEFIAEILDWFDDSKELTATTQSKLIYPLRVDSVKVGCMEGTKKADWLKVYELIK